MREIARLVAAPSNIRSLLITTLRGCFERALISLEINSAIFARKTYPAPLGPLGRAKSARWEFSRELK